LAANRKTLLVAETTIGADVDKPLDVHRDLLAEVTFNLNVVLDHVADRSDFSLREITGLNVTSHVGCVTDLACGLPTNSENISECDVYTLVAREIYTFNTRHGSPLPLFVLGVFTDDAQNATSLYDATLVANLLYRSSYFHFLLPSPAQPVQQVF
jgi:hypothetical protein